MDKGSRHSDEVRAVMMAARQRHAAEQIADSKRQALEYLRHGDHTIREIAQFIDRKEEAVRRYMAEMIVDNEAHVAMWIRRQTGHYSPVFRKGLGINAPYPLTDRKPQLEIDIERVRDKPKRGRPSLDSMDEDELFKRPPTVVVVRRDELVAALFGEPKLKKAA